MQCDSRRQSGTSRAGKNFIARNKNAIKDKSRKEAAKKKEIETRTNCKESERRPKLASCSALQQRQREKETVTISKEYLEELLHSKHNKGRKEERFKSTSISLSPLPPPELPPHNYKGHSSATSESHDHHGVQKGRHVKTRHRDSHASGSDHVESDEKYDGYPESRRGTDKRDRLARQAKTHSGTSHSQWKDDIAAQVQEKQKEKERLKREKLNERVEEYFPFGKPGCGAPIRSQSGKLLVDYQERASMRPRDKDSHHRQRQRHHRSPSPPSRQQYRSSPSPSPPPSCPSHGHRTYNRRSPLPSPRHYDHRAYTRSPSPSPSPPPIQTYHRGTTNRPVHPSMKSSIPFGPGVGGGEGRKRTDRERHYRREKTEKVEENDYRSSRRKSPDHDDYRRRKSPDHSGYRSSRHKSPNHDYRSSRCKSPDHGDYRSSRYKSPDYRRKSPGHDRRATGSSRSRPHTRQLKIRCGPHYGRGAGPHVNKYVLEEKHEKMRKEEQHKEFLRIQILEKQRQNRAEKLRREREELEDELRIQREREEMERTFQLERERAREKAEAEARRQAFMQEKIRLAEEAAIRAREEAKKMKSQASAKRQANKSKVLTDHNHHRADHKGNNHLPYPCTNKSGVNRHSAVLYTEEKDEHDTLRQLHNTKEAVNHKKPDPTSNASLHSSSSDDSTDAKQPVNKVKVNLAIKKPVRKLASRCISAAPRKRLVPVAGDQDSCHSHCKASSANSVIAAHSVQPADMNQQYPSAHSNPALSAPPLNAPPSPPVPALAKRLAGKQCKSFLPYSDPVSMLPKAKQPLPNIPDKPVDSSPHQEASSPSPPPSPPSLPPPPSLHPNSHPPPPPSPPVPALTKKLAGQQCKPCLSNTYKKVQSDSVINADSLQPGAMDQLLTDISDNPVDHTPHWLHLSDPAQGAHPPRSHTPLPPSSPPLPALAKKLASGQEHNSNTFEEAESDPVNRAGNVQSTVTKQPLSNNSDKPVNLNCNTQDTPPSPHPLPQRSPPVPALAKRLTEQQQCKPCLPPICEEAQSEHESSDSDSDSSSICISIPSSSSSSATTDSSDNSQSPPISSPVQLPPLPPLPPLPNTLSHQFENGLVRKASNPKIKLPPIRVSSAVIRGQKNEEEAVEDSVGDLYPNQLLTNPKVTKCPKAYANLVADVSWTENGVCCLPPLVETSSSHDQELLNARSESSLSNESSVDLKEQLQKYKKKQEEQQQHIKSLQKQLHQQQVFYNRKFVNQKVGRSTGRCQLLLEKYKDQIRQLQEQLDHQQEDEEEQIILFRERIRDLEKEVKELRKRLNEQ